jgi:hypothetical protein
VRWLVFLGITYGLLPGCRKHEMTLHDTEGRSFTYDPTSTDIKDEMKSASPPAPAPNGKKAVRLGFVLSVPGHYFAACDGHDDDGNGGGLLSIDDSRCRALTCSSAADCPPYQRCRNGTESAACLNGLCACANEPMHGSDVALLCLASTGAPAEPPTAVQRKRFNIAIGPCSPTCAVPSECRQP